MSKKTIGQRIRERRKELGLSQEELARRLGNKSRASVCTVEKDKEDLTTTRIRQYAEALDCTPAYLMGWEVPHATAVTEPSVAYFVGLPNPDLPEKALELWKQYEGLTPEKQAAFLNYLRFLQSES